MHSGGRHGQGLLALVILMGGIILASGIGFALITISSVNATFGYQSTEQAEAVATAGVEDALLQLARNNTFSSTGYSLAVGSSTATVTVTQNSPSAGFVTITSKTKVSLWLRNIQVVASENPTTGQTSVISWQDVQ